MAAKGDAPKIKMEVEGAAPDIESIKVLAKVPKSLKMPRSRPTPTQVGPKSNIDKQKVPQLVCASPRRHLQKEKPTM